MEKFPQLLKILKLQQKRTGKWQRHYWVLRKMYKVGFGYDVHQFKIGESFILGGVEIDFEKGVCGHSDGDVLTHSIIDAILGASSNGDIGKHFPSDEAKWKNFSSIKMLKIVYNELIKDNSEIIISGKTPKAESKFTNKLWVFLG